MKKEDVLKAINKAPNSSYIRVEFDMGSIEGKLFKDKKMGTFLIYADGLESLKLDFSDYDDEIDWIEYIGLFENGKFIIDFYKEPELDSE